jgi:hypothetical protein
VRWQWDRVVNDKRVKALIAGHFHSSRRECYRDFDWMDTPIYAAVTADKLFICPPVACKFQNDSVLQARGFRTYSITDEGTVSSEIVWYGGFRADSDLPASPTVIKPLAAGQPVSIHVDARGERPETKPLCPCKMMCVLVVILIVLLVVLVIFALKWPRTIELKWR